MNTNRNYEIVNGPNKDAIFDACKYAYSENAKLDISFEIAIGYTAPKDDPGCAYVPMAIKDIKITSIKHEDGSGESFNLEGYCKADLSNFGGSVVTYTDYKLKAYYNTKHREGSVKFTR